MIDCTNELKLLHNIDHVMGCTTSCMTKGFINLSMANNSLHVNRFAVCVKNTTCMLYKFQLG